MLDFLMKSSTLSGEKNFAVPLQLGGREGGFALSVAQMGMGGGIGMFVSIISRVRELFWASVGLLLMKVGTGVSVPDGNEEHTG